MQKENPKISVIIPTYNRAHLLPRAIQSVLSQTYQDFELIVVDDGSTDNTEEVVKNFKDKRIRYIQHGKSKGAPAARNTGIKTAKGEYIAFQDSDDEWFPEKLEKQMKAFDNASSEVGVVYTGFWRITKNNKKIYKPFSWISQKEGDIHKGLLKRNFIATPSIVVAQECFKKAGMFDENLLRLQDWELVLRLSKYYDFKYINEPLLISFYSPDSISADNGALIKAKKFILAKHFESFAKDRKSLSKHYYDLGIELRSNGDFKNGRDYFIRSIMVYPFNIKHFLVAFISLFGQSIYNKAITLYRRVKNLI